MKFGEQEEPTGWAGPIAKDLGQGVQGLGSGLAKQLKGDGLLPKFEFSRGYLSLYAIMFGLGVVVAALATMVAAVKVAEAKGVDSRIMAQRALVRLLTFSAVGGMAPLLMAEAGELARVLAGGFFSLAAEQLAGQLSWLVEALAVGTLASLVVPGGSAVMVGLFLFLLTSLAGVWLELAISHYLVFLLGLLIPILYGASINPDWRPGVRKLSGALVGAFLVPPALFLVWVVAGTAVAPWDSNNGFITRVGVLLVGLLLSLAAPIAVGLVLSYVVPAFAHGHSYDTGAVGAAVNRVRQRSGRSQSAGPRSSRTKRASDVTDDEPSAPIEHPSHQRGGVERPSLPLSSSAGAGAASGDAGAVSGAGAASGGAGAASGAAGGAAAAAGAAGPIAAAAVAWGILANKVRRGAEAARDKVGSDTSRAGRGAASGGTQPPPATPAGTAPASKRGTERTGTQPPPATPAGTAPASKRGTAPADHPGPKFQPPPGRDEASGQSPAADVGSRRTTADGEADRG